MYIEGFSNKLKLTALSDAFESESDVHAELEYTVPHTQIKFLQCSYGYIGNNTFNG